MFSVPSLGLITQPIGIVEAITQRRHNCSIIWTSDQIYHLNTRPDTAQWLPGRLDELDPVVSQRSIHKDTQTDTQTHRQSQLCDVKHLHKIPP